MGSGCGSISRAVASDTRGPRFESSHRQKKYIEHLFTENFAYLHIFSLFSTHSNEQRKMLLLVCSKAIEFKPVNFDNREPWSSGYWRRFSLPTYLSVLHGLGRGRGVLQIEKLFQFEF